VAKANFDITRKFVRVTQIRPNGLVEFEFSVGEPGVAAELVMPKAAFDEFCVANQVELLTEAPSGPADGDAADADFHWNLHQATHQRFR
jgi:phenol hydroxylase P0 protein